MAVAVNTTRKAVEISWETSGGGGDVDPPDGFPEPPGTWGGNELPLPDQGLPDEPHVPDKGAHPDQGLPETPELPDYQPPVGLPQPPFYPFPVDAVEGEVLAVRIFAQGQEGDWSNTDIKANDGLAVLTYPEDFTGESYVEVRSVLDGKVVDSGTITVE